MPYELTQLPYSYDALEPHIDARTMEIHHSKHHATYVAKLNGALEGTGLEVPECPYDLCADLLKLPESVRGPVRNNGGGHANHNFFWRILGPDGAKEPCERVSAAITEAFGSYEAMKEKFNTAATNRFGSGWAWVVVAPDGKLSICSTANQDNPWMPEAVSGVAQGKPIIAVDVWEHAYYLKYQNRRPEYLAAFWHAIDWDAIGSYYRKAIGECCGGGCGCHD